MIKKAQSSFDLIPEKMLDDGSFNSDEIKNLTNKEQFNNILEDIIKFNEVDEGNITI